MITNVDKINTPRVLGDAIGGLFQQHGDLYRVQRTPGETSALVTAAVLADPASGRTMTVRTTEPYLQLYTGVGLNETLVGKTGQPYVPFAGLCLECEGYPDAANTPTLGGVLRPGSAFRRATIYAFSAA